MPIGTLLGAEGLEQCARQAAPVTEPRLAVKAHGGAARALCGGPGGGTGGVWWNPGSRHRLGGDGLGERVDIDPPVNVDRIRADAGVLLCGV